MHKLLIAGAGRIGPVIAYLLANYGCYDVHIADVHFNGVDVTRLMQAMPNLQTVKLDVQDEQAVCSYLQKNEITALISCLPYFLNPLMARAAKAANTHYFDLTEDRAATKAVKALATGTERAFVPQCGLAPGFVGIVANSLIKQFDECHFAKLRTGALPERVSNSLQYALNWSTDGLINEYVNLCDSIEDGHSLQVKPLDGLESIQIDGSLYEAFNTSGGLGHLTQLYAGKIQQLNYKTIRYPGHCEKMRFLLHELGLQNDRATMKRILEAAMPKTPQDVVIIYVSVAGIYQGEFIEKNYFKKCYPADLGNLSWSAIQMTTASAACCIVDLVLTKPEHYVGLVLQEKFALTEVLANRFAHYFV